MISPSEVATASRLIGRARDAFAAAEAARGRSAQQEEERTRRNEAQHLGYMVERELELIEGEGASLPAEWLLLQNGDGEVYEYAVVTVEGLRFAKHYVGGCCYLGLVTECPKCGTLFTRVTDSLASLGRTLDEPVVHLYCPAVKKEANGAPVPAPLTTEQILIRALNAHIEQCIAFAQEGQ